MSVAAITSALVLALASTPSAEPRPSGGAVRSTGPTPMVQVGLGGGPSWRSVHGTVTRTGGPALSFEAGAVWNPRPRLRLGVSGLLMHTGHGPRLSHTDTDLAPRLRIGGGTARLWGYGIVGFGMTSVAEEGPCIESSQLGPNTTGGLGLRSMVGQRVSLGFEVTSTVIFLPPRGPSVRVFGLLVAGVRFGP